MPSSRPERWRLRTRAPSSSNGSALYLSPVIFSIGNYAQTMRRRHGLGRPAERTSYLRQEYKRSVFELPTNHHINKDKKSFHGLFHLPLVSDPPQGESVDFFRRREKRLSSLFTEQRSNLYPPPSRIIRLVAHDDQLSVVRSQCSIDKEGKGRPCTSYLSSRTYCYRIIYRRVPVSVLRRFTSGVQCGRIDRCTGRHHDPALVDALVLGDDVACATSDSKETFSHARIEIPLKSGTYTPHLNEHRISQWSDDIESGGPSHCARAEAAKRRAQVSRAGWSATRRIPGDQSPERKYERRKASEGDRRNTIYKRGGLATFTYHQLTMYQVSQSYGSLQRHGIAKRPSLPVSLIITFIAFQRSIGSSIDFKCDRSHFKTPINYELRLCPVKPLAEFLSSSINHHLAQPLLDYASMESKSENTFIGRDGARRPDDDNRPPGLLPLRPPSGCEGQISLHILKGLSAESH
ncbi:hypothetical protein EVAR_98063_1 [Eumeta japonica]|uniref:Uncharacterized protein n=1 Tax=Eumeta variegata TaxID=151549 RepID=A0A4C1WEN6_EUMVA|nr:hypothetical protein EVAR_98063_1 [Eumeta japonica]